MTLCAIKEVLKKYKTDSALPFGFKPDSKII